MKRYLGIKHYIAFLRRQPKHMQHLYAIAFAGSITAIIAGIILYTDYGFWHERYQREDLIVSVSITTVAKSPGEVFLQFWNEAKIQFGSIGSAGSDLLKGKETYTSTDVSR